MGARILIIEDDEAIRQAIAFKLEKSGYTVFHASDGRIGLETLKNHERFDLILLDLRMPEKDGVSFLTDKAQNEQIKDIPTIVVSNLTDREVGEQVLTFGIKGYLIKSNHSIDDIISAVEKVLRGEKCSIEV